MKGKAVGEFSSREKADEDCADVVGQEGVRA